jgi:hypothetical protein
VQRPYDGEDCRQTEDGKDQPKPKWFIRKGKFALQEIINGRLFFAGHTNGILIFDQLA